jgi:steroid delta-isomerase-like uncharacterized protein
MANKNETNRFSELEADNIAIVRRFVNEIWNKGQIDTIDEFFSPDAIVHYEHESYQGVNSWKEKAYETFKKAIPDFHIELIDVIANEDCVVVRFKAQGIHTRELFGVPPSEEMIKLNGMAWFKIIDGKVFEIWVQWNMSYLIRQLLKEIKTLKGILPLCSFCKKVRDDEGYWKQVDVYISQHTEADISHGVCPECMKEHYPELYEKWSRKMSQNTYS